MSGFSDSRHPDASAPAGDVAASSAPVLPPVSRHPVIGTTAVLLGSIISTITGRLTSFGLADIEGAVHAGFDEGAWITTAFTVGQMMIAPAAIWFGQVFGVRRVLMISCAVFAVSNFLLPFSPSLHWVLAFQFVSGISTGTFIPLTIGFVVLNLPGRFVVFGVTAYAMNLELSLNVAASIEGWFDTNWSWPWIFWDTALLAPFMLVCIHFGMPRQPTNRALLKNADWVAIIYLSVGLSLVYAALDQGNRLDWLNSGLINALLLGGGILIAAFFARESFHDHPWVNLGFMVTGNIPLLAVYISFFRFIILSTSYLVPQYLITVQNYRALDVGGALIWIALPQFLLAPIIGTLLRFIDARITMALGFTAIGCACFLAGQLTDNWATINFLPLSLLQAVGQTFALTSLTWFLVKHLHPQQVLTLGALLQTARLFGAELGSAFMQTFVRMREQLYSNLVGLHVVAGAQATNERLQDYANTVVERSVGSPAALGRAAALLASAVRKQSFVLAYIDSFMVLGFAVIAALILMLLLRDPPTPSFVDARIEADLRRPK